MTNKGILVVERILSIIQEHFHWITMVQDVNSWVKKYTRCHTTKSPYNEPNSNQKTIIVNNPMDLLCIDFMKNEYK